MRVLLAVADQQLRWALRTAVEEQPGLVVTGEAVSAKDLLDQTPSPDLVLVDWELPGRAATALLNALRSTSNQCRVIILSQEPDCIPQAQLASSDACLSKAEPAERFLANLRRLLANEQGRETGKREPS